MHPQLRHRNHGSHHHLHNQTWRKSPILLHKYHEAFPQLVMYVNVHVHLQTTFTSVLTLSNVQHRFTEQAFNFHLTSNIYIYIFTSPQSLLFHNLTT